MQRCARGRAAGLTNVRANVVIATLSSIIAWRCASLMRFARDDRFAASYSDSEVCRS
jgi:hypothetical protein